MFKEFVFPRDGFCFFKETSATARNEYYRCVFILVHQDCEDRGAFCRMQLPGIGGFVG
ncbi:hypothetical protein [uncultured Bacteroides sp.]|uniref:hypothetical protein n=1 Tax=uncultured Bacteroides sp. TaxID=162156 RepID=UPI00280AED0C|nr:hypothetical protein [uncultured Bacteroides sp.]